MAHDQHQLDLQAPIKLRLDDVVPPRGWVAPEGWEAGRAGHPEDDAGPRPVQRGAAGGLPVRRQAGRQEGALGASSTTSPSATRRSQVAATLDALKAAGFHWATRVRRHDLDRGRRHPAGQGRDPRAPRGPGREGPEPVRARSDHRRRAPSGAHQHLDRGDQRGRRRRCRRRSRRPTRSS